MIDKRIRTAAAVAIALVVAGCGSVSGTPTQARHSGPILVGSTDSGESVVVGEIYAAALNASGITASTEQSSGTREHALAAVGDGSIDVLPDYTGKLLRHYEPQATATGSDEVYARLREALPDGMAVLDKASGDSKDAIAVADVLVHGYGVTTIGDLRLVDGELALGGPADRETLRPDLEKAYSVQFTEFRANDAGQGTIDAIRAQSFDIGIVSATDPGLQPRKPSEFTITVNVQVSADDPECQAICGTLKADLEHHDAVESVEYRSVDQIWASYQERFADDPEMLEIARKEAFSAVFFVRVHPPEQLADVIARFEDADGVERIQKTPPVNVVILQDPEGIFSAENVVPVISSGAATFDVVRVLNAVSAKLTTQDLIELNDKVGNQHLDAAQVAAEWVQAKGLG